MKKRSLKSALAMAMIMSLTTTSIPTDAWAYEGRKKLSEECTTTETEEKQMEEVVGTENTIVQKESTTILANGTCNENIIWTLTEDYTLTISGQGEIPDSTSLDTWEWDAYCEQIKKIKLEDGITYIGNYAFNGMTALEEIDVAGSVAIIGEYAFNGIQNLKKLILREGVKEIKKYAFESSYDSSSNPEIFIPASITSIKAQAFYNTRASKLYISDFNAWCNIEFDNASAAIENDGVYLKDELINELVLPEDMEKIKPYTFWGWDSINEIVWPDNLKTIGRGAFGACSGLERLKVPASVTTLESGVFSSCNKLKEVILSDGVKELGEQSFYSCTSLTEIKIPNTVTTIGRNAFGLCTSIEEIVIPDSVTSENQIFFNNTNLKKLTWPISLRMNIRNDEIDGLPKLKTFVFTKGDGTYYNYTTWNNANTPWYYFGNHNLNISFEKGVTGIGDYMFSNCTGNKSFVIPSSVKYIGTQAIPVASESLKLSVYEESYGLTYAKDNGYSYEVLCNYEIFESKASTCIEQGYIDYKCSTCGKTTKETIPFDEHKYEECYTFEDGFTMESCNYDCGTLSIKETGTKIASGTLGTNLNWEIYDDVLIISGFGDMSDFTVNEVAPWSGYDFKYCYIEEDIYSIGESVFADCSRLQYIKIPDNITKIGSYAFYGCTSLNEIKLPKSLTSIEMSTFENCTSLRVVKAYETLESVGLSAFKKCDNLTIYGYEGSYIYTYAIEKDIPFVNWGKVGKCGENVHWFLIEDVLSIKGSGKMYDYVSAQETPWYGEKFTTCIIEEGVATIGDYAFAGNSELVEMKFPNDIGQIGKYAFYDCNNLERIRLPEYSYNLQEYAFASCDKLTQIENVEFSQLFGAGVFEDCISLNEMKISTYIDEIPEKMFKGCYNLKNIEIPSNIKKIGASAFENCGLTEIKLPCGVVELGARSFANNDINSVEFGETIEKIEPTSFENCNNLNNFIVAETNENIKVIDGMLYNLDATTVVLCPPGKTGSISILRGVTCIGEGAFYGCTKITGIILCSSVTTIKEDAFKNTNITSFEITSGVEKLAMSAFEGCKNLEQICVDEENKYFAVTDKFLHSKDGRTLFLYYGNDTEITVPEGYDTLGKDAFANVNNSTRVNIPFSMRYLYDQDITSQVKFAVYDNSHMKRYAEWHDLPHESRGMYTLEWSDTDTHYDIAYHKFKQFLQKEHNGIFKHITDTTTYLAIYSERGETSQIDISYQLRATDNDDVYTIASFTLKEIREERTLFTCEYSFMGIEEYGYECRVYTDFDNMTSSGYYNLPWSFSKGKYCTAEESKSKQAADGAVYIMLTGMAAFMVRDAGIRMKDLGFINYDGNGIMHNHNAGEIIDATCTEDGKKEGDYCDLCGAAKEGSIIPATGHTKVVDEAVGETCTESGLTEGSHCSTCNQVLVTQQVIPAIGHNKIIENVIEPTCIQEGYTTYRCTICEKTFKGDYTDTSSHKYSTEYVVEKKATLSSDGAKCRICTVCNAKDTRVVIPKISYVKLSKTSYTYNGKNQTPTVLIKDRTGALLKENKDYTVKYSSDKRSVGLCTVTIIAKGNYSGTKTHTYTIVPKGTSITKLSAGKKKFTVKWKKQTKQTSGYQIQYATNSKFKGSKNIVVNGTKPKTISKLKAKTTYYVKIRTYKTVKGKQYYSSWSKVKKVKTKK